MSAPSIKKHMIITFSQLANFEDLGENNSVILLTAIGSISGKIMTPDSDNPSTRLLSQLANKFTDDYDKQYPSSIQDHPFDGYIELEDAVIHLNAGGTNRMPYLIVFFDQIIGVTMGEVH